MNNQQPLFVTNHNNTFGSQVPDEAGIYNVYVSPQSKAGNSKNQNPMASMDYIVLDGTQKGKHIYDRLVWTNNTQENHDLSVKRFNTPLIAAGYQDNEPVFSIPDFVQKMAKQNLAVETEWEYNDYKDAYYLVVKSYRSLQADGSQPNGQKRPQANGKQNNNNNGFSNNGGFGNPQPQAPNNNGGAPIDIDNDQLPF